MNTYYCVADDLEHFGTFAKVNSFAEVLYS